MSPTDAQKRAREYVKRYAMPCPCCGASVLMTIHTDYQGARAFAALKASGTRFALTRAEDAEREIAERDFKRVDPIGGRIE